MNFTGILPLFLFEPLLPPRAVESIWWWHRRGDCGPIRCDLTLPVEQTVVPVSLFPSIDHSREWQFCPGLDCSGKGSMHMPSAHGFVQDLLVPNVVRLARMIVLSGQG